MTTEQSAADAPDETCLNCCALVGADGCIECGHSEGDDTCDCENCQWSRDERDRLAQKSIDDADAAIERTVPA